MLVSVFLRYCLYKTTLATVYETFVESKVQEENDRTLCIS